ncbi:MAG: BrnT family toxin [Desulfobacterales bacterium]|nr:BrnT family toxin [Desulfobacterales bacterium]
MNHYKWNKEKNERLKIERGVSFEQITMHIERGDVLDIVDHPNQKKYPNQQLLAVKINNYVYLVPFVENKNGKFLKTIIPSRKATRSLGGKNE